MLSKHYVVFRRFFSTVIAVSCLTLLFCTYSQFVPCQADPVLKSQNQPPLPNAELISGKTILQAAGGGDCADRIAFSPDGKDICGVGAENTIRLWDVASGKALRPLSPAGELTTPGGVAYSPDGKHLATGYKTDIRIWDRASGSVVRTLTGHASGVGCIAYSPDGTMLASGAFDNTARLWDAVTGQMLHILGGNGSTEVSLPVGNYKFAISEGLVSAVAFSPDGKTLATVGSDRAVKLWDCASGRLVRSMTGQAPTILSVAYSPDGQILATGAQDKTIWLWNAASGACLRVLNPGSKWIQALVFTRDSKELISGSYDSDGGNSNVDVWEVATGKKRTLIAMPYSPDAVTLSPDGKTLGVSSVGDCSIILWHLIPGVRAFP